MSRATFLLTRSDVKHLLTMRECISAVEEAFRLYGAGEIVPTGILGMHAPHGGFHIKAAMLGGENGHFFAAKVNANFPDNPAEHGLPTIQGVVLLYDAANGFPLAVMDSMQLTAIRTAAATAVAARHLARQDSRALAICGCGVQAEAQVDALVCVLPLSHVNVYDLNGERARAFATLIGEKYRITVEPRATVAEVARDADVIVTCTPSKKPFLRKEHVRPGTFIAAVGADNPEKQELHPDLFPANKVVADVLSQCAEIGDLHHAIDEGVVAVSDVHAELGQIVAGKKPGRTTEAEITIFDSTGTALQDVAAAAVVYSAAKRQDRGQSFEFAG